MLIHKVMLLILSLSVFHILPTSLLFFISIVQKQQSFLCLYICSGKNSVDGPDNEYSIYWNTYFSKIKILFFHPHIFNIPYKQEKSATKINKLGEVRNSNYRFHSKAQYFQRTLHHCYF